MANTMSSRQACVVVASDGLRFDVLGHAITVKLAGAETTGESYCFEVVTPAGHGIPPHVHEREDEVIYVLEGEYGILLGEQRYTASAGATLYFPRRIPHAFQNIGATPGKTLWLVTPGTSFEAFFNELSALPAGPPDLARVAAIFATYGMQILPPAADGR